MDVITKAFKQAVDRMASVATAELQNQAIKDGWDYKVASSITVDTSGGNATVNVSDKFAAKAFDHEFGTQNHQPKATVRKADSDKLYENKFAILFDKFLGKAMKK
jgi:hypothetical protein